MSYSIGQPSAGAQIGAGLGKGLSETIPKELDRYRLASGLERLSQESANLNPMQQLAKLSGIPGISPQMIQSFGELAKLQAQGQALSKLGKDKREEGNINKPKTQIDDLKGLSKLSGLSKPEDLQAAIEGYIPPSQGDILTSAAKSYHENPAFYKYDINNAVAMAEKAALRDQSIIESQEKRLQTAQGIEDRLKASLKNYAVDLGAQGRLPPDYYSTIETEALNSLKATNKGGKGWTQEQATKYYGKLLDDAARDYANLYSLGGTSNVLTRKPSATESQISNLQKDFKKRGDLRNFASKLITDAGLSPTVAYSKAYPVENNSKLFTTLKSIPDDFRGRELRQNQTERFKQYDKIIDKMTDEDSPLSIGQYLMNKSYDPQEWLSYLKENKSNLTNTQLDETNKNIPTFNTLSDLWIYPKLEKE